jgi:c-di-GMP-binding flagellar brake protein YcgR
MSYQYTINEKLLPGSYTVVEGQDSLHTGTLSYLEGDIFEVQMSKRGLFKVGETVKVIIYAKDGVFNFDTTVIAAKTGMFIFLLPPDIQKRFSNKRSDPRVETNQRGVVYQITDTTGTTDLDEPIEVKILNVSLGGIGFSAPEDSALRAGVRVMMNMELGTLLPCLIEVIHKLNAGKENRFGGKFVDPSPEMLTSVRSFILTQQIRYRGEEYDSRDQATKESL